MHATHHKDSQHWRLPTDADGDTQHAARGTIHVAAVSCIGSGIGNIDGPSRVRDMANDAFTHLQALPIAVRVLQTRAACVKLSNTKGRSTRTASYICPQLALDVVDEEEGDTVRAEQRLCCLYNAGDQRLDVVIVSHKLQHLQHCSCRAVGMALLLRQLGLEEELCNVAAHVLEQLRVLL